MTSDLRIAQAETLLESFGHEIAHCRQVRDLAVSLFDQLEPLHHLGSGERAILNAAALLHDIGWSVSGSKHHKISYTLIKENEAKLIGFTPQQIEVIANVARYHRKSPPLVEHEAFAALPQREQLIVEQLAALLRIADGLDRPHLQLVQQVRCELAADRVIVHVHALAEAGLHIEGATRKRALFDSVFALPIEFAIAT
jgi:exopolyphosphatase/guanosine-5'-triphosphate,3'-diphosphate pyrophosphatase